MLRLTTITVVLCQVIWMFVGVPSSLAQSSNNDTSRVADFYRGKQLRMIIRSDPGGGYDLYSRLLARFIVNHIPGNPTIIPENMPAAGGIAAANYVANVAPRDGTVLTMVSQSAALDRALGLTPAFTVDLNAFGWIGNLNDSNPVTYVWRTSPTKTIDDARKRTTTLGSTGAGDISSWLPSIYNAILGTKFKIIDGYPSAADIKVAMQRGELDGFGASPLASVLAVEPDSLRDKMINVLVQVGVKRDELLPDVPLLTDLARTPSEREILTFISKALAVGRPIGVGPGVPPERVAALRKAFDETVTDPEFIAEAKRERADIGVMSGETVQHLIRDVLRASPDLKQRTKMLIPLR
jgi:tripartite-type tricarboxylate transporter receptor subunit TctC